MLRYIKKFGFTFIELLIAVLLMAILAVIVIPSLTERRQRVNEDMAAQVMLKDAQFLEKWRSTRGFYSKSSSDTSVCPTLPYRLAPESGEPLYYISTEQSTCNANTFTLKARPICETIQKSMGVICLDSDTNVNKGLDLACNNGSKPSEKDCIKKDDIPNHDDNDIDDENEDGKRDPDWTDESGGVDCEGPHCIERECELNPTLPVCSTPAYCKSHMYQPQCKCQSEPKAEICGAFCDDVKNAALPVCKCIIDEKSDTHAPECTDSDDPDYCKYNKWAPKCQIEPSPTPDPSPTPPIPVDEDESRLDACGNNYTCLKDKLPICNSADPKYSPGGESWRDAWTLNYCGGSNSGVPNYKPQTAYDKGAKVLTDDCVSYVNISDDKSKTKSTKPGADSLVWAPCYTDCPNTAGRYKSGEIVYDRSCTTSYECLVPDLCSINPELYEPGSGSSWKSAWRR